MRAWAVATVLLVLVLALAATRGKLRSPPMLAETCPALPDPAGSPARLVPSILLIGERKCGTSSLARYLGLHSHVLPPNVKEPGYLMRPLSQLSLAKYSQYFALATANRSCIKWFELAASGRITTERVCEEVATGCRAMTFDASAGYLSEASPRAVFALLPHARALALVRAPHLRALSHWCMHLRFKREGRKGYQASTNFSIMIERELKLLASQSCSVRRCPRAPYLSPGLLYEPNVARWMSRGPLMVLFTEEMAEATAQGSQRLVDYLGPALRWCGLEPAGMASLLSSRKPLRANVASVVHVAAGGGADEQEHASHTNAAVRATLNRLVPYFERPNRAFAARLDRLHLPKEWNELI